jgi:acetyl-CoA carboxylase biotin carboxylase subunit
MARRSCACAKRVSQLALRRILIANRGEIAVRIIRTCRKLNIETVLAASAADLHSVPAQLADRRICIGPARPAESYLKVDTIVHAALATQSDAIHPGYGFLSERASLASLCEANGVVFIGPTAAQIEAVGDKLRARSEAEAAGVPVVRGCAVSTVAEAMTGARNIGVPLLVKAVVGGGGRGLKRVDRLEDLPATLELAAAEAGAAFGDARVYLERFIASGRHVEVQILGDGKGHIIHLGERDCSVQRRYQKLVEETPAVGLSKSLREALHSAAVRFSERLLYRGAGTVEFLVDRERETFHFLEMNARIQVEHPVTEAVTGVDLIAEQIAIAAGAGLQLAQSDIQVRGCAIECRVNAEDPAADFRPSPGRVREVTWPCGEGIRVDTYIAPGSHVPPFYDSLMAKIIAHAPDRPAALTRLRQAIASTRLTGVHSNLPFHTIALADPEFQVGGFDTGFVTRLLERSRLTVESVRNG